MKTSNYYSLTGKLTAENVELINEKLMKQVNTFKRVKVCLSHIDKIDLAGFNALISAHMKAKRANKELTFVNPKLDSIQHLISQTNFTHVFSDN